MRAGHAGLRRGCVVEAHPNGWLVVNMRRAHRGATTGQSGEGTMMVNHTLMGPLPFGPALVLSVQLPRCLFLCLPHRASDLGRRLDCTLRARAGWPSGRRQCAGCLADVH